MRKFTPFLLVMIFAITFSAKSQQTSNPGLKGNGEVFYFTSFDWGNPDDPKGWTAPEGFYFEDPTDNGYNWHWWPNDSLISQWVSEPPFRSSSPDDGHLALLLDLYNNWLYPNTIGVDNSVVFPTFDCSDKTSVVVRYETTFMCYSDAWDMFMQVSRDNGVHWANFDVSFGCGHKERPNDIPPGGVAIYEANISEVAAGASELIIKFLWRGTDDYFWLIDDFQLAEAYDNDLQLKHFAIELDDGDENTTETFTAFWPISQLAGSLTGFEASVYNFGEYDQYGTALEVDITRNSQNVWNAKSEEINSYVLVRDTVTIDQSYAPPAEFGHYKIRYNFASEEEEQTPQDNTREFFMNVTDSIYSRADDTPELNWSYSYERYADSTDDGMLLDHFVGVKFPIYSDCEVNSVSVYITGGLADGLIDFAGSLWLDPPADAEEEPYELTTSNVLSLDSSMFNTWVTLPLEKDGESEFLVAGDMVFAGFKYWNYHQDMMTNRNYGLRIASDKSVPVNDAVSVAHSGDGWFEGEYLTKQILMIRLNLNDNSNIIDGIDRVTALNSLGQNYPNPVRNITEIEYEIANPAEVQLEIKDMTGRTVLSLNEGRKTAGKHTAGISAESLDSGIYFYTLRAGDYTETKRMTVSK
jgi:hypothetical protein